jgi:hypothetical protein
MNDLQINGIISSDVIAVAWGWLCKLDNFFTRFKNLQPQLNA